MATYTTEAVTSTVRRWIVPAAEPWGAAAEEVGKAWRAAQTAYREAFAVPVGEPLADNALRFRVRDEEIVIEFRIEVPS